MTESDWSSDVCSSDLPISILIRGSASSARVPREALDFPTPNFPPPVIAVTKGDGCSRYTHSHIISSHHQSLFERDRNAEELLRRLKVKDMVGSIAKGRRERERPPREYARSKTDETLEFSSLVGAYLYARAERRRPLGRASAARRGRGAAGWGKLPPRPLPLFDRGYATYYREI